MAESSLQISDKAVRQHNDLELKYSEEETRKLQASSSSRIFSFYESSLEERGPARKSLYDDHSSPDNCQTSQVRTVPGRTRR